MTPRRAEVADIGALLALWGTSRTPHATTEDRADDVARVLERSAIFVVDGDAGLTGAVIAAWDGWRGSLYRLAVVAAARRRGVGLALVRAGEGWLVERGCRRISVLVAFEDTGARELWAAAGYGADAVIGRMVRDL